ncbi:MAG: hypothetical protein QOD44_4154 [Solirubrobacteraceae bacterium]|jgi:hypothetical protein|nr:hypothetical protein [Solirubrobacteraceae bacterium]
MTSRGVARAVGAAIAIGAALPAAAAGQGPAGLPGPPPGNGLDIPSSPGTAAPVVPAGTAAALAGAPSGPGLLGNSAVAFNRAKRSFALQMACDASGTVTARAAAAGPLGKASYRCAGNRSTARFQVSAAAAKKVARARALRVTATVHHAGRASKLWFTLLSGGGSATTPGFWTDGHLQCTQGGAPLAFLAEPDFTTAGPTVISTRGWIATYTASAGWHWIGLNGENAGRWETWTAGPTGVQQFHPAGAVLPVPWTWGPISVPGGQGISMVGVYEIVYWVGGRPDYRWQYVNAGDTGAVAAGGPTPACIYP